MVEPLDVVKTPVTVHAHTADVSSWPPSASQRRAATSVQGGLLRLRVSAFATEARSVGERPLLNVFLWSNNPLGGDVMEASPRV